MLNVVHSNLSGWLRHLLSCTHTGIIVAFVPERNPRQQKKKCQIGHSKGMRATRVYFLSNWSVTPSRLFNLHGQTRGSRSVSVFILQLIEQSQPYAGIDVAFRS